MTEPSNVTSIFERLEAETPTLLPVPTHVRGFNVRLELVGTEPPVWRQLELPGDLTLPRLHDVIQSAMGWTNSHLHRFRTGDEHQSPYFVTQFDIDDGDEGVLEDDVRLDQLVAAEGDEVWYEYDFGDSWDHRLVVEAVLDEPAEAVRCIDGELACPPEDCSGIWGYSALAAWVRSGYDHALMPEAFDSPEWARAWLPNGWHPDHFDLDKANNAVAAAGAEPVTVVGELVTYVDELDRDGILTLRRVLARPMSHGTTDVTDDEAARLTEAYRIFLEVIGDGVTLSKAGYLPPAVVVQFAEASGIADWWIGKAYREDSTPPVRNLRDTARALGLVSVRKGRLAPTAAARHCHGDARALWQHIVSRLPVDTKDFERQSGWMALAVVGGGTPTSDWYTEVGDLLFDLGWRIDDRHTPPSARSLTLWILGHLAGDCRDGRARFKELDPAVAATARAVIRPRNGEI